MEDPTPLTRSDTAGNMRELIGSDDSVARQLSKEYGGVVRLHGVRGTNRYNLLLSDPASLVHLFGSSTGGWDLSDHLLTSFKSLFGPGVAAVEGADHTRQRRIMHRALNPYESREMLPNVQDVSAKVRSESASQSLRGLTYFVYSSSQSLAICARRTVTLSSTCSTGAAVLHSTR